MRKSLTTELFIEHAKKIHGDKYRYENSAYKNSRTKISITCPVHGPFLQGPIDHLHGRNCARCVNANQKITKEKAAENFKSFVKKSNKLHNGRYDYSKSVYINSRTKLAIICPAHGEFLQLPVFHARGMGCPKCLPSYKLNTNTFIEKAIKTHGDRDRYNYNKTAYVTSLKKVIITCKNHGDFQQTPVSHIQGKGCPRCGISKGEAKILSWLQKNNISFIKEKTFPNLKGEKKWNLRFDFFLPNHNLIIEFDGFHHNGYLENDKIFNKKTMILTRHHDCIKNEFCVKNNINLIRIPYTEFKRIDAILENILSKPVPASNILPFFTNKSSNKTTLEEAGVLSM